MGVVFFMVFAGICIAIGIVPLIAGIIILVRRFLRKKKTGEKYKKSLVGGLLLTGFGFVFAGLPLLWFAFLLLMNLFSVPLDILDDYQASREAAYYDQYLETETEIELEDGDLTGFLLDDKKYAYLESMFVVYKDKRRGEPVANVRIRGEGSGSSDKKLTLFSYGADLTDGLLCLQEKIFCDEDKIDELTESYRKEEFEYTCEYFKNDMEDLSTSKVDFSDDIFFTVANREKEALQKFDKKKYDPYKIEQKNIYYLSQDSRDGLFSCAFTVNLSGDEVYITDLMPLYSEDSAIVDQVYLVTDPKIEEELRALSRVRK